MTFAMSYTTGNFLLIMGYLIVTFPMALFAVRLAKALVGPWIDLVGLLMALAYASSLFFLVAQT